MTCEVRRDFVFAGHLDAVSDAREEVMDFVREHCSLGGDEFDVLVAVQEALANAALHGCRNDISKSIHCSVTVRPTEIEIVVRDAGNGFNVEQAADPSHLDTNLSESGRGIALMRALMTDVSYTCGGSEVHLKKSIDASSWAAKPGVSLDSGSVLNDSTVVTRI